MATYKNEKKNTTVQYFGMVATLFQGQSIDRKKSKKIHQDDPITPESSLQNKTISLVLQGRFRSFLMSAIPISDSEVFRIRNPGLRT